MLVVLADDFSGAAELAGIAANHGLRTELCVQSALRQAEVDSEMRSWARGGILPDLLAIDCGTRSLSETEARRSTADCVQCLMAGLKEVAVIFYKKTDSVFRGHVLAECQALLEATAFRRVLLVPANPSRGRCIEHGVVVINGRPLSETIFAKDPAFPALSSEVSVLLGYRRDGEIDVPDVTSVADLDALAGGLPEQSLPAGGADFFEAWLRSLGHGLRRETPSCPRDPSSALWICGSLAAWSGGLAQRARAQGFELAVAPRVPESLPAVVAIGGGDGLPSDTLLARLIDTALVCLERDEPRQLWVEGGETAGALFQRMGWCHFAVRASSEPGVGVLEPLEFGGGLRSRPLVYVKPGSYAWVD